MRLAEAVEKHRLSFKIVTDQERDISHFMDVRIIEETSEYLISEWSLLGGINYYKIHYFVGQDLYFTISTTAAMKKGYSILTTCQINFEHSTLKDSDISYICHQPFFAFEEKIKYEKKQFKKIINIFISFLSIQPIIRVREVTSTYQWFFQDDHGRQDWYKITENLS